MPARKGTKRKAGTTSSSAKEPEAMEEVTEMEQKETAQAQPEEETEPEPTSKTKRGRGAKSTTTTSSRGGKTSARGRPRKGSKTEVATEGEQSNIEGEEEEETEKPVEKSPMQEKETSSSSNYTTFSSSPIIPKTSPINPLDTDESGIGLLKRILYVIPNPPAEAIGNTLGEFRNEVAKRYSVEPDDIRIFDPRTGRPGTELMDDDMLIQTLMGTEIRVFIKEIEGATKEWIFWFDQGNQRKGISHIAHESMESPEISAYMSKPSLVDIKRSDKTHMSTASIPIAGTAGTGPSLIIATAEEGRSPQISVIGGEISEGVSRNTGLDTTKQSIETMQELGENTGEVPPGGGEQGTSISSTSSHPTKRGSKQAHATTGGTGTHTRSHDPGFIAHDVLKYHTTDKSSTEPSSGTTTSLRSRR